MKKRDCLFPKMGWKADILFSALGVLGTLPLHAGGISCHFAEIRVSNLQPGRTYTASRDVAGEPYKVENKTDTPLDFQMVVREPTEAELQKGFEAIPDPSWITFEKAFFSAEAGQSGATDYYISIPTGPAHVGKKYQVQIGVQTFGGPTFVQMGLMGRALLSVAEEPAPWSEAERRANMFSARMSISPPVQLAVLPKSTKRVPFDTLFEQPFFLKNDSDYPVRCRVDMVETKESFVYPPPGFIPAPKGVSVKLSPRRFTIPPHSEKAIKGVLRVPQTLLGKAGNYYVVLRAVTEGTPGEVEAYTRLFLKGAP